MTGAEIALLVNGAMSITAMVLRAQAAHPETPEAERGRILTLVAELDAYGTDMDRWRPLPPPSEAPRG